MALPADVQQAVLLAHQTAADRTLWPGWRFEQTPLVLYGGGEGFLIGHPSPPAGYTADGEVAGRPLYRGPALPEMAANTAQVIAGHLSALAKLPAERLEDEAVARYARLLLHEGFHVFQQTSLPDCGWNGSRMLAAMAVYPENDPPNNALAIVENDLLAAALDGDPDGPAAFLAVRHHRHRRLERRGLREVAGYEKYVEYNEGTPTYVEHRAGLPVAALKERLALCNRGGKWASYQRYYYSGAALALLLDRLSPGWPERFAAGGKSLQTLLESSVVGELPPVSKVLQARGFTPVLEEEERAELARRERVAALLAELREGPGQMVQITLPPTVPGLMWDPRTMLVVEPGVRLHSTICGARGPDGLTLDIAGRLCLEEPGEAGTRTLTLRLPEPPVVERGARLAVTGPGLTLDAPAGVVEETGEGVVWIRL
ncbi:MAG: hypothetical protein ACOY94_27740 [Bacillota bacterium]